MKTIVPDVIYYIYHSQYGLLYLVILEFALQNENTGLHEFYSGPYRICFPLKWICDCLCVCVFVLLISFLFLSQVTLILWQHMAAATLDLHPATATSSLVSSRLCSNISLVVDFSTFTHSSFLQACKSVMCKLQKLTCI